MVRDEIVRMSNLHSATNRRQYIENVNKPSHRFELIKANRRRVFSLKLKTEFGEHFAVPRNRAMNGIVYRVFAFI